MRGHGRGVELYRSLPEWRDICTDPHTLPHAADHLIADIMVCPFSETRLCLCHFCTVLETDIWTDSFSSCFKQG